MLASQGFRENLMRQCVQGTSLNVIRVVSAIVPRARPSQDLAQVQEKGTRTHSGRSVRKAHGRDAYIHASVCPGKPISAVSYSDTKWFAGATAPSHRCISSSRRKWGVSAQHGLGPHCPRHPCLPHPTPLCGSATPFLSSR